MDAEQVADRTWEIRGANRGAMIDVDPVRAGGWPRAPEPSCDAVSRLDSN
jgi:hypothetical protein